MTVMVRSHSALHVTRVARKTYRCDAIVCEVDRSPAGRIVPGQHYVSSALPPGGDLGYPTWQHARFHEECIAPW